MPADIIIHADSLFDYQAGGPRVSSLAVRDGRILAVGSREEIGGLRGPKTETVEVPRGLIVPGFHDFHVHLFAGGLTMESVDLHEARCEEEAAALTAAFAARHPENSWVLGFNWYHVFWKEKGLPTRWSLDRLIPDRPVFLFNAEYHGAWVNTAALKLCGIHRGTADPPFGKIERDANGEPTGFLYETAMGLAGAKALDPPVAAKKRIISKFLRKAAAAGVTSVHDMLPLPGMRCGDPTLYARLEENGELTARIFLEGDLSGTLEEARSLRDTYTTPMLRFSGLKQFVDGVATTYTAYLVDPYSDRPDTRGGTLIPPEELSAWVTAADAGGFRVRLHACGDNAVRTALNCYEAAIAANGARDSRHTIEHIETIHPGDYLRFRDLGVTASIQPEHLAMTERFEDSPYLSRLGPERERYLWPNRSLQDLGVPVCYGSDFPVVDIDPLKGIFRAVTRRHNDGKPPGGWTPSERVSAAEALFCYTTAGARGSFMEDTLGLLRPGYAADIAVLDTHILECETEAIPETRNLLTVSGGKIVFRDV